MPKTAEEEYLVSRITAAISDPGASPGGGLSIPLMVQLFNRIVTLRDFAQAQQQLNQTLDSRLVQLELQLAILTGRITADANVVSLHLTPAGQP